MIALWLSYAVLVAALLAGAAAALDALARLFRRPTRGVWVLALLAATLVPAGLIARTALYPGGSAPAPASAPTVLPAIPVPAAGAPSRVPDVGWLDTPLLATWALASLLVLGALLRSAATLTRRRRGWQRTTVDGVPVLVAPDTGPAVVGLRRSEIVLPDWTLSLEPGLRALILRHETEHLRARDARLLLIATLALVVQPLNPVLWWLRRRLCLAVELDCDRRVLAVHGDVERYGLLLLAVGQRATRSLPSLAPTLAEPTPLLERRIDAMSESLRNAGHGRQPGRTLVRAAVAGGLALLAIVAACETPAPSHVLTPDEPALARGAAEPTTTGPDQSFFEFQV
ncbi:MAG TPA: M56 family metallopeptidase, partial [Gemmatimonadaceae bacterium]|nr:M56 family metallopeptidase [Gemmatimonadaceae bacterium]